MYTRGELVFFPSVGPLAEPITLGEYRASSKRKCQGIFSHNDQQRAAQTLTCQEKSAPLQGMGGRIADQLMNGPSAIRAESFSVAGTAFWPQGLTVDQQIIHRKQGA